jgi:arylsulfatase A-like enzyme
MPPTSASRGRRLASERRSFRGRAWVSSLLVSVLLARAGGAIAAPNFVIVVTDDQRWDDLVAMPVLGSMMLHSVQFTNAFATTPICAPSRASILSGLYAHHHGVRTLDGSRFVGPDLQTLATWLHRRRYRTGLVGKYLNGYLGQGPPTRPTWYIPPGWDIWRALRDEEYYDYAVVDEHGNETAHGHAPEDYSTDVLRDMALEFLRDSIAAARPFLLYFAPYAPHVAWPGLDPIPAPRHEGLLLDTPPLRPPSFMEAEPADNNVNWWMGPAFIDSDRIKRLEALLAVDEALGVFLSTLEAGGVARRTVVIFTSDNGYLLGEHRLFGKQVPYEEMRRVPLIIRDPLHVRSARKDGSLVIGEDIAPTVAALAHAPRPPVDGHSLVPLLRRKQGPRRSVVPLELWLNSDSFQFRGVGTRRWSYMLRATGEEEAYHLATDLYQLRNLVGDPARGRVLERLRRLTAAVHAGD